MTIRILNVLLDNDIGGPQIRVLSVAKELRKYEIETIMLCPAGEGRFAQRARNEHFKTYQIMLYGPKHFDSFLSVLANFRWLLTFLFSVLAIAKIIKSEKIDIVHTNGLLNLQAPVAAFLTGRKLVWHLISSLYPKILVSFLRPFITVTADRLVVVAKQLEKYYLGEKLKSAKSNVSVVYECVDVGKFASLDISKEEVDKLKKEFNISSSSKVIGCIGNINPAKGYEYFIQSANHMRKKLTNIKFIVVGGIPDSQRQYYLKLQALVSSLDMERDIIFTGRRDDVPQILSMFDVFVLSSIAEGTPLVVLEAMAMEKPVVATHVGAVSEQVLDGETGIIVPPKHPQAMAKAVIHLLENSEERVKMGRKGRERVKDMFSLERCVDEHGKLYEKIRRGRQNIGILTFPIGQSGNTPLSNLVDISCSLFNSIYVITGNEGEIPFRRDDHDIYVFKVQHKSGANLLTRVINYAYTQLRLSFRLARLSKNVNLWIFSIGGEGLLLPMLTAKLLRKDVVIASAGSGLKVAQTQKDPLARALARLKSINYRLSDRIIIYSERLIEEHGLQKYRHKILVAHRHFLDFDKFRAKKKFNGRYNLIGYIGSLSRTKGILSLLEAIPKVLEKEEGVRFLIGGVGQLRTKVEQYLSDENLNSRAKFSGWIPHNELPEYLNNLKLLVLPSYTEGLPNIILEAMACGTPVLATSVGAIPDIIKDGETGFIMEDNSPECIARNVIRALNHPNLEEIAKNAHAFVEKEFTYEAAVRRYERILASLR